MYANTENIFGLHYQRNLSENVLDKKPSRDCRGAERVAAGNGARLARNPGKRVKKGTPKGSKTKKLAPEKRILY